MFTTSSSSGNIVIDFDHLTNNLILEFLDKEVKTSNDESTTDSIFEEISHLSNGVDDRPVDEIIREAESLLKEQSKFSKFNTKNDIFNSNTDEFCSDSVLSEESIPKNLVSCPVNYNSQPSGSDTDVINKICDVVESGDQTNTNNNDLKDENIKNFNNNICSKLRNNFKTKNLEKNQNTKFRNEKNDTYPLLIQSDNLCNKMPLKICCDKSKTILSKQNIPKKMSPVFDAPVTRESLLKNEIDILQEKLKDTEERLQSLRIQHNSLSQIHRDLKENQNHLQEESELLKLDVQHLTECVNVLRNELQMAKNDRKEVIEIQKVLQNELEENKIEKKKFREQCEKDAKTIQDLQRQCKEMERILMRKHPDSVSALIVASKSVVQTNDKTSLSRKLLEQRIAQLELDAKEQDLKAQRILANVQTRFNFVRAKYETHIADLETQVLSLQEINTKLNEKINSQHFPQNQNVNSVNNYSQTDEIQTMVSSTQTDSKLNTDCNRQKPIKKGIKEETHLLATIRGMRVDLAIKDKAIQRLSRELDECKKTIKKLQKEAMKTDKSSISFNPYKICDGTINRSVDQNLDKQALEKALQKIKLLEMDYKTLYDKRLQDLKSLQVSHEREMSSFHETFQVLQQRLTECDENFSLQKCLKVPVDYYALKAKVSSLERRHSEREQRLHMLVEALSKGRLSNAVDEIFNENN